jgi:hypothetical protein
MAGSWAGMTTAVNRAPLSGAAPHRAGSDRAASSGPAGGCGQGASPGSPRRRPDHRDAPEGPGVRRHRPAADDPGRAGGDAARRAAAAAPAGEPHHGEAVPDAGEPCGPLARQRGAQWEGAHPPPRRAPRTALLRLCLAAPVWAEHTPGEQPRDTPGRAFTSQEDRSRVVGSSPARSARATGALRARLCPGWGSVYRVSPARALRALAHSGAEESARQLSRLSFLFQYLARPDDAQGDAARGSATRSRNGSPGRHVGVWVSPVTMRTGSTSGRVRCVTIGRGIVPCAPDATRVGRHPARRTALSA